MKLQLCLTALLATVSLSASAHSVVTVEHMTCQQAENYVKHFGRYWKDAGPDGAIPIYPVYTLENIKCTGKVTVTAQTERTLDDANCVVGYYCKSY